MFCFVEASSKTFFITVRKSTLFLADGLITLVRISEEANGTLDHPTMSAVRMIYA